MAIELASQGVRVNSLVPGWIETDLTDFLRTTQEAEAGALSRVPMGRWGRAEEIADAALFLADENERQRRLLETQGEQLKHVTQRALMATREADKAEEEKNRALEEMKSAQRAADDAKNASWAQHQDVVQRAQLARVNGFYGALACCDSSH